MVKCPDCAIDWDKTSRNKSNRCNPCRRLWEKAWRKFRKAQGRPVVSAQLPRAYHQNYGKTYYQKPEVKERQRQEARRIRQDPAHAQRLFARTQARNAIRRGDLVRKPCEVCGDSRTQAHHDDYEKPLDVRWSCRQHHVDLHTKAKAEGK
jgi:hypothetical protein